MHVLNISSILTVTDILSSMNTLGSMFKQVFV